MTNETLNTIIGAVLALTGVLTSSLIVIFQEYRRRKWDAQDEKRKQQISILDKRCDQIEQYLEAVTKDFRSVMYDCEFLLTTDDTFEVEKKLANRKKLKDETVIFTQRPIIHALADNKLNDLWNKVMEISDRQSELQLEIYALKFDKKEFHLDGYITAIDKNWNEFVVVVGQFYHRLDEMKKETVAKMY